MTLFPGRERRGGGSVVTDRVQSGTVIKLTANINLLPTRGEES